MHRGDIHSKNAPVEKWARGSSPRESDFQILSFLKIRSGIDLMIVMMPHQKKGT
jgi:hypothetical protein